MTSLQQTAMLGGAASAKVASYVLVAADAGDAITMSNAGSTTITANTGLFATGDIVTIINIGTGTCTITAGTATVTTSGSLVLAQNQGGVLRFTSPSEAIFLQFATPASGDIEGVTAGTGISGGGTSGTVTITNSMATAIDAKGDLIAGTGADAFSRLAVGANNTVLTADSAEATGLKWATPAATSGPAFRAFRDSSQQSFSQSTFVKIQFNAETFDTDNCFDSTTNYRFTPNKAGYYDINVNVTFSGTNSASLKELAIYKNGAVSSLVFSSAGSGSPGATCAVNGADLIYFDGTTDYVEAYIYDNDAVARNVLNGTSKSFFSGVWIRS
jgi:hypothetical protein